jgi:hypothetical protein
MGPARRHCFLAGVVLFAATTSRLLRAEEEESTEPIRLTYQASQACPDEIAFVERIRARTTRARVAWPGEAARVFDVRLDGGPPFSGSMTVTEVDHSEGARHVHADSCGEVADALALVVALAIDPRASAQPATAPPIVAPWSSPSPHPVSTGRDKRTWGGASRPSMAEGLGERTPKNATAVQSTQSLFAGADLAVTSGVAPDSMVGASPYVGWRATSTTVFAPSIRIALVRATSSTGAAPSGSAGFLWTVGRLDACPVAWAVEHLRATACTRLEAGTLEAAGGNVQAPQTRLRAWFAAGPLARLEWSFLGPVFFDAEATALFRATNDRFYFMPDTTIYQVPIVGLGAALGVGSNFL